MLRQGMVEATATYIIEVVGQWVIRFNDVVYFLFETVRVPVFHLSENWTENRTENRFHIPVRAVNSIPVHKTIYWIGTRNNHSAQHVHVYLPIFQVAYLPSGASLVCGLASGRSDLVKYRGVATFLRAWLVATAMKTVFPQVDYRELSN